MVTVKAGTYRVHNIVLFPGTITKNPSNSSVVMPRLWTIWESMKLWVAPLATKTETLSLVKIPQIGILLQQLEIILLIVN